MTPASIGTPSRLQRVLNAGQFAVTIEIAPPIGPDRIDIEQQIELLHDYADAFNVTDNQSARVRTSSLAVCIMIRQAGFDPILQITCRDRNRLSIQSDLLGASVHGIVNVLALSGDHPGSGDHPHVKSVFDIDSINLLKVIRMMRDDHVFDNGAAIPQPAPSYFIGAAANPFAPPHDFRPVRLAKKVAAGAQFVQTQLVYNVPRFREYMKRVVNMGLHEQTAILAGVGPIRSEKSAVFMKTRVAGMDVPDEIIRHLKGLNKKNAERVGLDICVEIAEEVRQIEGVRGLHLMAVSGASNLPGLVSRLGLHPRPNAS